VLPAVKAEFAPLAEPLGAPVDAADVRPGVRVDALVLFQVLLEGELLRAELAHVLLHLAVDELVPVQAELGRELLRALVAEEYFLFFHF